MMWHFLGMSAALDRKEEVILWATSVGKVAHA
jgi:hypothetical protein